MTTSVTETTFNLVNLSPGISLSIFAILTLLILLVAKEIISQTEKNQYLRLHRRLNIAIIPLLLVLIASLVFEMVKSWV